MCLLALNIKLVRNTQIAIRLLQQKHKLYRFHAVVCIISYGYDHQDRNKVECRQVKTKADVGMYLTYLM
jgi:hypothetical protein